MEPNEAVPQTTHDPIIIAESLRDHLKIIETLAREFSDVLKSPNCTPLFDKGEVIAQSMLALRHIEDARMRYGKVIQYAENKIIIPNNSDLS